MNDIQSLIDRQLGLYTRINYDNVLKRLVVDERESFYGLQNGSVVDYYDQDPPIFACRFCEAPGYEHILALANEDGKVAIQNTSNVKTASTLERYQCHNNAVFDLAWMPGHMNFVTVSGDHTACLWDAGEGSPRRVQVFAGHTRSVKTVVFRPQAPAVFASGARDGHVLVWDARCAPAARPDNRLVHCHASFAPKTPGSHGKRARLDAPRAASVTGLAFRDDVTLLSCGECDGNIKAWDLRKNYSAYTREPLPLRSIPYAGSSAKNGYTNLALDAARTRLYASCMDDVIYCFNVAALSARPERRYVGHENSTFYIKTGLSADGAYLVSGSSDKLAYVWSVRRSRPLVRLAGHRAEVTCAAWCQRGDLRLVTCSDDARHKIWRLGAEFPDPYVTHLGRAEPVPRAPSPPAWGAPDTTPSSLKRRAPPAARAAKRARADPARRTKRCLTELLNAAHDADGAAKRPRPAAAEARPAAGVKRAHEPSWHYPAPPAGSSFLSPSKPLEARPARRLSPRSPPRVVTFSTPTKDLPDFVRSGEAPHLRLMSPARKKPDAPDWLTRLARERRRAPPEPPARPAPAPAPALDRPRPTNKCRTLLKYFTIEEKSK